MSKIVKLVLAGVVVVSAIGYLLFTGLTDHTMYYAEVTELLSDPSKYNSKGMRVSGDVVENSVIDGELSKKLIKFQVVDAQGSSMHVEFGGVVPDAFEEGVTVILEGNYDTAKEVFIAKTLLAKCPSKYETEDPNAYPEEVVSSNM